MVNLLKFADGGARGIISNTAEMLVRFSAKSVPKLFLAVLVRPRLLVVLNGI
jgi:hypothetical protein